MSHKPNHCYNRHNKRLTLITRRNFLEICAGVLCGGGLMACRSKASLETSDSFVKIANINDLKEGVTTFQIERVVLYREANSVRALSLVCTHQECPVVREGNGFLCPCHGSKFDTNGRVLTGPATENLHWLPVQVDADGSVKVRFKLTPA